MQLPRKIQRLYKEHTRIVHKIYSTDPPDESFRPQLEKVREKLNVFEMDESWPGFNRMDVLNDKLGSVVKALPEALVTYAAAKALFKKLPRCNFDYEKCRKLAVAENVNRPGNFFCSEHEEECYAAIRFMHDAELLQLELALNLKACPRCGDIELINKCGHCHYDVSADAVVEIVHEKTPSG